MTEPQRIEDITLDLPPTKEGEDPTLFVPPSEGGKSLSTGSAPAPDPTLEVSPDEAGRQTNPANPVDAGSFGRDSCDLFSTGDSALDPGAIDPNATIDTVERPGEGRTRPTQAPGGRTTGGPAHDFDFSLSPDAPTEALGDRKIVAGYEILGELGRGGMGVVYKARQLRLNRLVALKVVLAGAHASDSQLVRFYTEAEAVAGLQHPNIVQIYEVGTHDELPYFSLEYVDGGSLADKLDRKPQPPKEAARILEAIVRGVVCAHEHGIIHRDLKPANVLLTTDGVAKITDFGLAKRLESDTSQTKSGTLMGTPNYMAPEQAAGNTKEVGPRSDQYALGAMLYEMLTGRPPLVGTTLVETLDLVKNKEPLPPSRLQPGVPRDLETICLKCLQKEPDKRYSSAESLGLDLKHFLAGEPIRARPVSHAERAWRWCRRNPRVAMLTGTVLVLLATALAAVTALGVTHSRQQAAEARRLDDERKAAEETRQLAQQRLEQATETIKTGDHKRALEQLRWTTPLFEAAPDLEDVRAAWRELRSQVELYAEFKNVLDGVRFAFNSGSPRRKQQAQGECRQLIELNEQIHARTGRASAGLPPLSAEQQQLFREDEFESLLIAALLEIDLARGGDLAARQAAARRAIDWLGRADRVLPGMRVVYANRCECWGTLGNKDADEADKARAQSIKPTSAVDHFWHGVANHSRAEKARREGNLNETHYYYRKEIAEYAALLQLRPDHFWGYFNWANCQIALNNWDDALVGYCACIRIRPDFPWPYNNLGTVLLRQHQNMQALRAYDSALAISSDYAEARANRGIAYYKLGKLSDAVADLDRAIELNPDSAEAHAYRGMTFAKLGEPGAALAELDRAIELNSNYDLAYEHRADVRRGQKQFEQAIADYTRALSLTADKGPVYLKLADVHHDMGRDDDAINDCTEALAHNPKYAEAAYKRAGFYVERKDYARARDDYTTVLTLFPTAVEPRRDRATLLWRFLKEFDASLADWEVLARRYPKDPEPQWNMGIIWMGRRQYETAVPALQKALELKPDYVGAAWALAEIALWQGDLKEALNIINPLAVKRPLLAPDSLNIRGDIYRAMGRLDDAAADYRELITLRPTLVETYVSLALVYAKQDKPSLAKEWYEKLVARNADSAAAYLRRAAFRRTQGEFDAALEDCARACQKDPDSILPGLVEASIEAARGADEQAVRKAESLLAKAPSDDGQVLYAAACVWSLAAQAAAARLDKKGAAGLVEKYTDRAATLLQQCLDKGFHDLVYPEHNRMADDPALEPVRRDPRVSDLLAHRR
jgi:tetratricopeptide (TPR) repeat protein/tRNA A-37 threonylcarbamoyl transferase component Bud32